MRFAVISLLLAFAGSIPALAQASPPALVVTLRDESGAGVPGIAVVVTDRSGATVLARGTTGADGAVSFAMLPTSEVRVQVSGQLPDGVSLRLPGQDAGGITVTLGVPAVQLNLRSEADGIVRPDPASITLEPGVPLTDAPFPTARPAATLAPTMPALLTTVPDVSVAPESAGPSWPGLMLLALLLLGMLGVLLLQLRGEGLLMRRRLTILALGILAGGLALLPRAAWAAGCGVQDLGACVDAAQYTFWFGLASLGWSIDRTLLLLAYQLATFRWWLVSVAFTSAYDVLTQLISPLIVPVASVAVVIGCLALLLVPLFGRVEVVRVRHALVWVVIAPILITLSGPLIVQTEELRSTVGTALFQGVRAIAPGAIFGAAGSDMASVAPLYPANPCGQTLARQGADTGPQLDDLAAALLWADAEDIHCPERGGPDADVPDAFYVAAPDGPGFATQQAIGDIANAAQRTAAVAAMQRGAIRTFLGLLPSALAVLDALAQFVFALCLIALWIGLPIGLLFVFFQQTADPVTGLFRRVIGVLQVSWSTSVVLGLLMACLLAAAELRNAAAYTGFAIGALVLTSYILLVAVSTLKTCLTTLSNTVAVATGLNPGVAVTTAGELAAGAAGLGLAAATGGAGMALASAVAAKQTGSGRYALGAALGQFRPIAKVGEIAAAMGETGELISGAVAGGRSQRGGVRALAVIASTDSRRTDDQGLTSRDHALERRVERIIARRPTVIDELGTIGSAARAVGGGALTTAVLDRGRQLGSAFQDRVGRVSDGWQRFRDDVADAHGGSANSLVQAAAGVTTLDRRLSRRGQAMHLHPSTRQVVWSPRVAPADLPADALHEPRPRVRVPRLLALGYHVQANDDGTISAWQPTPAPVTTNARRPAKPAAAPDAANPQIAALNRRIALVETGGLLGDLEALRAERARLEAAAATQPKETTS